MEYKEFDNLSTIDLTGKRVGRLIVLDRADDHIAYNGRRRIMWRCKCDCGKETVVRGDHLRSGRIRSCGCFLSDTAKDTRSIHNESKTHLYGVWSAMKHRCNNPNATHYEDYGGRGISVCDEWRSDYTAFRNWALLTGYQEGLTIDRIDNNGNYCPENCRWVTSVAQANNRRSNIMVTFNGETHNLKQWSDILGIRYGKLHQRFAAGWTPEKAFTTN